MNQSGDRKLILVRRATRLDGLVARYNTLSQARFAVETQGQDFQDYLNEHDSYQRALESVRQSLLKFGRLQEVDRSFLPNFLFGKEDVIFALGQDGLVANTLKYLDGQPLFGVNPEPSRWDGVLLPFQTDTLVAAIDSYFGGRRMVKQVTMAQADLNDGQKLRAVNDLFIGQRSHVSSRYSILHQGRQERQSSSGVIVSTGMGSTGWFRSLMAGAQIISSELMQKEPPQAHDYRFPWDANYLFYTVREPFPSRYTSTELVFGRVNDQEPLRIVSESPEGGVIFSDGVENDALSFNSGSSVEITLAKVRGHLVV